MYQTICHLFVCLCVCLSVCLSVSKYMYIIKYCYQFDESAFIHNNSILSSKGAVDECLRCLPLNPGNVGLSPTLGHDRDSSFDTSTGCFQEADSRVIYISYKNLFHFEAKINMYIDITLYNYIIILLHLNKKKHRNICCQDY